MLKLLGPERCRDRIFIIDGEFVQLRAEDIAHKKAFLFADTRIIEAD